MRCSGIHNHLTSVTPFTPFEKLFLSNGLNFVCTPPPSHLPHFLRHYFDDPSRGWPRFARTLGTYLTRQHGADAPAYLPKFKLPSTRTHAALFLEGKMRGEADSAMDFQMLDSYRAAALRLLRQSAFLPEHCSALQRQHPNHTAADLSCLRRLMSDGSITIKPADKNLGMVLVDTSWYEAELRSMLASAVTYQLIPSSKLGKRGKPVPFTVQQLQTELLTQLHQLAESHSKRIECWSAVHCEQVKKYLKGAVTQESCTVPGIYLLIKVHKVGKPLSGRPIVPSTRWATTPASVLVDHLLQEVLRSACLPHLVKDTKSFVCELERTPMPTRSGVLLTADIGSLYTNIDTQEGLRLVRAFLVEQRVEHGHVELIMTLLTFVMHNSYLSFHGRVYKQIDGTAMGTPCAPTYANIFVYMLEKSVLHDMRAALHLYRRFLDDIFAYLEASAVPEFISRMNSLHPKLHFDFVQHNSEAAFLDLHISKGHRFASTALFDLSVHQKKMNLYLYIPFHSFHTAAMKRSFIQTELMRYVRNSNDREDYYSLRQIFYQRLRDRGYPHSFLTPLFNAVHYEDRHYFLWPSSQLHEHPLVRVQPPRSLCLQKRLRRWFQSQPAFAGTPAQLPPPVFVIPYSPLSHLVPTRALLSQHWHLVQSATSLPLPPPIVAYQSSQSLLKLLVYTKARREEEARQPAKEPKLTQASLRNFFQRAQ